jgi:hypothetical protein
MREDRDLRPIARDVVRWTVHVASGWEEGGQNAATEKMKHVAALRTASLMRHPP